MAFTPVSYTHLDVYKRQGELCSASQLFDFVSQGTVECGGDWGGYWSGKDTAFELLSTIMDDFTALDYYTWIYEAGGMDCYKEMYGQYNMEYFPLAVSYTHLCLMLTTSASSG